MAEVVNGLDRIVARMPGVREAVGDATEASGERVRAVVAAHRNTGALASGMDVKVHRVDGVVSLEDPAVVSINYGHWARDGVTWVSGIHAIEAGL
ncbi:hypothetical protein HOS58_gp10 [Streptomyces phage Attoomi]|uniref:Head-to-tail connector protein n=1 Tax=Streptomyces phage Attoomi TaxID=2059881 RepID=A0A2H5BLF7_9CAUD|nr:hypothetical protein HOS58_gp10 [Streptomyces phage Attoomi]AUG87142.1 hypothetical protein SEA_ATTOOMI_10 [Streptomyces phage Attoomi]